MSRLTFISNADIHTAGAITAAATGVSGIWDLNANAWQGAAALVSGDVVMACLFGGNSIKAATAVGSRLLTVQEARDAGILGIDITSVTDKFMKENPGMLRTFIEVTHEANAVSYTHLTLPTKRIV